MGHEFRLADKDGDNDLKLDELDDYMRKMNQGRKYDKSKIEEMHREIDSSNDGKVTLEEFCKTYAKQIENYELKIRECKDKSTEIRLEIVDINSQKQEIARAETMNQFGIMEGSVLIVTV